MCVPCGPCFLLARDHNGHVHVYALHHHTPLIVRTATRCTRHDYRQYIITRATSMWCLTRRPCIAPVQSVPLALPYAPEHVCADTENTYIQKTQIHKDRDTERQRTHIQVRTGRQRHRMRSSEAHIQHSDIYTYMDKSTQAKTIHTEAIYTTIQGRAYMH